MSVVRSLRVQSFRSYHDMTINLTPGTTIITGKNGSGKTSLIEAIYINFRGSSFRGSDAEIVHHSDEWYRIDTALEDDKKRTVKFFLNQTIKRKQFEIDGKVYTRLPQQYKYPVVLFEPDDMQIVTGSPSRRRYFIDHGISQSNSQYSVVLRKYDRALKQRNSLLKHRVINEDELFVWNVALSEYGAEIIRQRQAYIKHFNEKVEARYRAIAQTNDTVFLAYSSVPNGAIQQKLLTELTKSAAKDITLGFTSIGPHRDDVRFYFNNSLLPHTGSRGEVRSIILALKFIEAELINDMTDRQPIILLDDVFSELDKARRVKLELFSRSHQVIITTTETVQNTTATVIDLGQ